MLNLVETVVDADQLSRVSDDELAHLRDRSLALVPDATHPELLTYEQAANVLGVKYERVASLVSRGVLIAEKLPRDARKWLGSDQVAWYRLKQEGKDGDLPNPAQLRGELSRRNAKQVRAQSQDTFADVRAYVAECMADSQAAHQLNAALEEIAKHLAGALARDAAGVEKLDEAERARLNALLAMLTGQRR
jgi:hypothetical protein